MISHDESINMRMLQVYHTKLIQISSTSIQSLIYFINYVAYSRSVEDYP